LNIGCERCEPGWGAGQELRGDDGSSLRWVGESNLLKRRWEDSEKSEGSGSWVNRITLLNGRDNSASKGENGSRELHIGVCGGYENRRLAIVMLQML